MFPIRKILAPVDFSARSISAAEYASSMALQFGAELNLVHVLPPLEYEYAMIEPRPELHREQLAERASRVRLELEQVPQKLRPGVNVQRLFAEGEPAAEIIRLAQSEAADLIVMPTHGRGAIRRFLLGSVVSKVLHDSECPVWTGVQLEPPAGRFQLQQIICAVDFGGRSRSVYCQALALAQHFKARLSLLYATPRLGFEAGDFFDETWRLELAKLAREKLRHLAAGADPEPELLVEPGDPDKVVAEAAKRLRADLVVIGRGAISEGIGRLRANSYAIIRQSPCPVLSV